MKGDFSRLSFDKTKHYSRVRMQQGRVQLDADWNEQEDITAHRIETEIYDFIGQSGAPESPKDGTESTSFRITVEEGEIKIGKGRYYVEGMLFENETQVDFYQQPDYPIKKEEHQQTKEEGKSDPKPDGSQLEQKELQIHQEEGNTPNKTVETQVEPAIAQPLNEQPQTAKQAGGNSENKTIDSPDILKQKEDGIYLAYLDVWQRHITALEDPTIREVALGGLDTTTRVKNIWQVKLHKLEPKELEKLKLKDKVENFAEKKEEIIKPFLPPDWKPDWERAIISGLMAARINPEKVEQKGDKIQENQLYRVEIHQGGNSSEATFKWSRDNGTIAARIEVNKDTERNNERIILSLAGQVDQKEFANGNLIEYSDEAIALTGQPGILARVTNVQDNILTVKWLKEAPSCLCKSGLVRRWDCHEEISIIYPKSNSNEGWINLEKNIQVKFDTPANASYKTGDYWLIPARNLTGDIEWPRYSEKNEAFQPPHGIQHSYCSLAVLKRDNGTFQEIVHDCRVIFKPLTSGLVSKAGDTMTGDLVVEKSLTVRQHLVVAGGLQLEVGSEQEREGLVIERKLRETKKMPLLVVRPDGWVGIGTKEKNTDVKVIPGTSLTVAGDIKATGSLTVNEATVIQKTLTVKGETTIEQELTVKSLFIGENEKGVTLRSQGAKDPTIARLEGSLSISGEIIVEKKTILNDTLRVVNNTTIEKTLTVKTIEVGEGNKIVTLETKQEKIPDVGEEEGILTISQSIEVKGKSIMKGEVIASGGMTIGEARKSETSLNVNGKTMIDGRLTVKSSKNPMEDRLTNERGEANIPPFGEEQLSVMKYQSREQLEMNSVEKENKEVVIKVEGGDIVVEGDVTAKNFLGDGSALTGVVVKETKNQAHLKIEGTVIVSGKKSEPGRYVELGINGGTGMKGEYITVGTIYNYEKEDVKVYGEVEEKEKRKIRYEVRRNECPLWSTARKTMGDEAHKTFHVEVKRLHVNDRNVTDKMWNYTVGGAYRDGDDWVAFGYIVLQEEIGTGENIVVTVGVAWPIDLRIWGN